MIEIVPAIIAALSFLYFIWYSRRLEAKVDEGMNRIEAVTLSFDETFESLKDPEQVYSIVSMFATAFYRTFSQALKGQEGGRVRRKARVDGLMAEVMNDEILPGIGEEFGIPPFLIKMGKRLLENTAIGDHLDEHPEDLMEVIGWIGEAQSRFQSGQSGSNGILGNLSQPGQTPTSGNWWEKRGLDQ